MNWGCRNIGSRQKKISWYTKELAKKPGNYCFAISNLCGAGNGT
jgi:hypothetical protein